MQNTQGSKIYHVMTTVMNFYVYISILVISIFMAQHSIAFAFLFHMLPTE